MKKPVLVIMAAGMGSRYGGLKQIDPVDAQGHIIMDFSIYDAICAGFEEVIFVIKKENEADFQAAIGNRIGQHIKVQYAYQEITDLPEGFSVPEGRQKPWGTGHAILSCRNLIEGPFAVINADDYYGRDAYRVLYEYLANQQDDDKYRYCMVGYQIENTLTENGYVARGVCEIDDNNELITIHERTKIEAREQGAAYTEDDGKTWISIPSGSTVSMNMWGFSRSILEELQDTFPRFLESNIKVNPLKCEYFLPTVVDRLIQKGKATATVLRSTARWYGVTYKEDKAVVVEAIQKLKDNGIYPQNLWEK